MSLDDVISRVNQACHEPYRVHVGISMGYTAKDPVQLAAQRAMYQI